MQLIGSIASPYVRRIRLLLAELDQHIDFNAIDIFSESGRAELIKVNPTLKVPALEDNGLWIYDSRVIARYLFEKFDLAKLTWHQENLLTLIDGANDSLVTMLISKRSGIDIEQDIMLYNIQRERLALLFEQLNGAIKAGDFTDWHYPEICLFCLLDWAIFRELYQFEQWPALMDFYHKNIKLPSVVSTDPRL